MRGGTSRQICREVAWAGTPGLGGVWPKYFVVISQFVPGYAAVCGLETVREQAALFDDLRAHAEKMMRAGVTVEEAERRYIVPKRFQDYELFSWGLSVGAAMQSYFAGLASPHPAAA